MWIDPHKRTHTAVAIDEQRRKLGELEVAASSAMTRTLLRWASAWSVRLWAIEGSDGLGRLLAQQLVAAGETVVEVPPTLTSQARPLAHWSWAQDLRDRRPERCRDRHLPRGPTSGRHRREHRRAAAPGRPTRRAVPTASPGRKPAAPHLRDLVPGGARATLTARDASKILGALRPSDPLTVERKHVMRQLTTEIRQLDKEHDDNRQRTRVLVEASATTLTDIFGISHVLAAKILGHTGPIGRFATADAFANYTGTAPIEVSSGDAVRHRLSRAGNRQLNNALHLAAHVQRIHAGPGRDY